MHFCTRLPWKRFNEAQGLFIKIITFFPGEPEEGIKVTAEEEEDGVKHEQVYDENDDTMEEPMVIDTENIVEPEVDEVTEDDSEVDEVTEVDSEVDDGVESVAADEDDEDTVDSEVDHGGFDSTADFGGSDVEEIEAMEDSEEEEEEEKITRPNVSIRFT